MPRATVRPLSLLALLLGQLALLARGAAEGGGHSEGHDNNHDHGNHDYGHKWWVYEYEHSYVEVWILIVLVLLALSFEIVWHFVSHYADHSYGYGKLTDSAASGLDAGGHESRYQEVRHVQLFKELTNRAGGEFMTLGFLAICVFAFNSLEGFNWLLDVFPSEDFALPKTADDWLHLTEVVHIQLFMGMLFYFFLISRIVAGSVIKIRKWEELRLRRVSAVNNQAISFYAGTRGSSIVTKQLNAADAELSKYMQWRQFFIERLLRWSETRPLLYRKVLHSLEIDPRMRHYKAQELLRSKLEAHFAFSAYLALNVEEGIRDSIVVHRTTWVTVLAILGTFELLIRYAHVSIGDGTPVFIAVAILILCVMAWVVRRREARIIRFAGEQQCSELSLAGQSPRTAREPSSGSFFPAGAECAGGLAQSHGDAISVANTGTLEDRQTLHQQYSTEIYFMRLLQTVIFMLSYVFSRTVLDIPAWHNNRERVLLFSCLFLLLFFLLSHFLPSQVPSFLALMALPPFEDDSNIALFFAVIADERNWQGLPEQGEPSNCALSSAASDPAVGQLLPVLREVAARGEAQGELAAVCQYLLHLEQRMAHVEGGGLAGKGQRRSRSYSMDNTSGVSEGVHDRPPVRPCSGTFQSRAGSPGSPPVDADAAALVLASPRDPRELAAPVDGEGHLGPTPSSWRRSSGALEACVRTGEGQERDQRLEV